MTRRALLGLAVVSTVLLGSCRWNLAEAASPPPPAVVVADAATPSGVMFTPPTWPYDPVEVRLWWNAIHPDRPASGSAAYYLAGYMNAIVAQRIGQYLLALYLAAVDRQVPNGARWDRVAACESGGRWNLDSGNGYYGGLQFLPQTWRSVGGTGLPSQNSREEQIRRAEILRLRSGLGQWPVCGSRF